MRLFWTLLFALIPIGGVASFVFAAMSDGAWLPQNISQSGRDIDTLFYIILAITGVTFLFTQVLLVYSMYTARGDEKGKGEFIHGQNKLEITWTIATAAILVFVAFYQMPTWARSKIASYGKEAVTESREEHNVDYQRWQNPDVLVTASQFLWQFRYPVKGSNLNSIDPDYLDSFELVNELHVPAGETVLIHLRSRDVLHSFWIPAARVKQDALPGNLIPVWFDTKNAPTEMVKDEKTGEMRYPEYELICAELCGWGHYRMRAKVVIHPTRQEYDQWREKMKEKRLGRESSQ